MLEYPQSQSKQKSIIINFDNIISKNNNITLLDADENVIISFDAIKKFKTLIISNDKIQNGKYSLYVGGTNDGNIKNNIYTKGNYIKGSKIYTFEVSSNITKIGKDNAK